MKSEMNLKLNPKEAGCLMAMLVHTEDRFDEGTVLQRYAEMIKKKLQKEADVSDEGLQVLKETYYEG